MIRTINLTIITFKLKISLKFMVQITDLVPRVVRGVYNYDLS